MATFHIQYPKKDTNMTLGIHHLGLTVNSLSESVDFFTKILNWKLVKEDPSYPSAFVSDGTIMLTLWKVQIDTPIDYDRKSNIGLHHFALKVDSFERLETLYNTILETSFKPEFSPQPVREGSQAMHFIISGPSSIRIEFICPA